MPNSGKKDTTQQRLQKYRHCCMPQCSGKRFDITHRFPRNRKRLLQWLTALKRTNMAGMPDTQLRRSMVVCSRHFRRSDYLHPDSRSLNRTVVPSLNLSDLRDLAECRQTDSVRSRGSRILSQWNEENTTMPTAAGANISDIDEITLNENDDISGTNVTMTSPTKAIAGLDPKDLLFDLYSETDTDNEDVVNGLDDVDTLPNSPPMKQCESEATVQLFSSSDAVDAVVEKAMEAPISSSSLSSSLHYAANAFTVMLAGRWLEVHVYENDNGAMARKQQQESSFKLDALWLRYHCRCDLCYDAEMETSRFSILQMLPNMLPKCATVVTQSGSLQVADENMLNDGDENTITTSTHVKILWRDGHESSYTMKELFALGRNVPLGTVALRQEKFGYQNKDREDLKAMSAMQIFSSVSNVDIALNQLQSTGVLIIEDIEATSKESQAIIAELLLRRLLPHLPANLSRERRHLEATTDRVPQTNCTYMSCYSALQILSPVGDGDDGVVKMAVVDGYQAAKELKTAYPDMYEMFSKTAQPLLYRNSEGLIHTRYTPIIRLSPENDDDVEQIVFSPQNIRPTTQAKFQQIMTPMRKWASILSNPESQWEFELKRNTLVILDNWRVCWYPCNTSTFDCVYVSRKHYLGHLAKRLINTTVET